MKSRPANKSTSTCRRQSRRSRCRAKSRATKNRRHRALPARWPRHSSPAPKTAPPFDSLDFPDRHLLYPHELADRLGCCIRHVYDLIAEGQLRAINISGGNNFTDRRSVRVPIECWRQFLRDRTV